MEEDSVDKLSQTYISIRTEREALKDEFNKQDKVFTDKLGDIENRLLEIMNKSNTNSMSTNTTTVLRRVAKRYNPSNWDTVYDLIYKHKAFGLLHKRINDINMQDFLNEHQDEYPAGLNVDSRYAVTVKRKPSSTLE